MEGGAVLGDAGEEVGDGAAGGEKGEGFSERLVAILPPGDEVDDCGDQESGAEGPEEDREGRPAADGTRRDLVEIPEYGD